MKKLIFFIFFLLNSILYANNYSVFFNSKNYGLIDNKRNVIFKPKFSNIYISEEGFVFCENDRNVYYVYTPKLELIHFTPENSTLNWCGNHEIYVTHPQLTDGSYTSYVFNFLTCKKSEYRYKKQYLYQPYYYNNLAVVLKENNLKFSVVDRNDNELYTDFAQADWNFSEGLLPVIYQNGKSGYIDTKGNLVLDVPVYKDERMGGPKIEHLLKYRFHDGVAFLQINKDIWVLLDKEGNMQNLPENYSFPDRSFSNGLVVTENKNHKFGYMNKKLELAIPCIFNSAKMFIGKYAIVVHNGKDAIVDADGNIYYCRDFCK